MSGDPLDRTPFGTVDEFSFDHVYVESLCSDRGLDCLLVLDRQVPQSEMAQLVDERGGVCAVQQRDDRGTVVEEADGAASGCEIRSAGGHVGLVHGTCTRHVSHDIRWRYTVRNGQTWIVAQYRRRYGFSGFERMLDERAMRIRSVANVLWYREIALEAALVCIIDLDLAVVIRRGILDNPRIVLVVESTPRCDQVLGAGRSL